MDSLDAHRQALVATARAWRDPDHGPRKRAVARTLELQNRFTPQAVAFAVNQQMGQINGAALRRWLGLEAAPHPQTVGVIEAGNVPMAGLQDYLAVTGIGLRFMGCLSERSPWLLRAFAEEVEERGGAAARFTSFDSLLHRVDALIGSGTDETVERLSEACDRAAIPAEKRLLRGNRYAVAVLDGREHQEQRLRLAEDVLLHEGLGCRNVALVFAPADLDADPYFEAFSVFRSTFPAHEATGGALKMQQAFLAAVGAPHAYGEGLVYLVSRGEAEVQGPGHLRWVPYSNMDEVSAWIADHADRLQLVTGRPAVLERLPDEVERLPLGDAQRPSLDWRPDGVDTAAFLTSLGPGGGSAGG